MNSNTAKYQSKNLLKRFLLSKFLYKISSIILGLHFDSLLDVGCGEGYVLDYLKKKTVWKRKKIIGIDIEKSFIEQAKKINPEMDFQAGNVYDLKFVDRKFDAVLALELLEHLKKPDAAIKELWRVTNKTLILSIPDEPMFTILRFLSGHNFWQGGKLEEHINHWNEEKFRAFIRDTIKQKAKIHKSVPWLIVLINK